MDGAMGRVNETQLGGATGVSSATCPALLLSGTCPAAASPCDKEKEPT